ncbi:MAG TPA: alpha/beta hydrolase [Steroidobacteraceae bacterium]|nr:alpha/beta hydrolase [Steroidobacteraceae bacterium]
MRSSVLAAACVLLSHVPPAGAAAMSVTADVAPATSRADVFPRAPVDFPDGVVATPDVEYANLTGFRPLVLDLYREARGAARHARPLVIYVHGGGWRRGDSRTTGAFANFPRVLASLAARGYVVASINYRLSGEARYPAAVRDVNSAITYLRAHAGQWGIDPARIVLWGDSAGAYLAAMSATTCNDPRFAPPLSTGRMSRREAAAASAPRVSDCVQAVVCWYGLFDLGRLAAGNSRSIVDDVQEFLGCARGSCGALARRASPLTHVSRRTPPMLLMHGTADTEVPSGQTVEMAAALRAAHVPVQLQLIAGANHGWIAHNAAATRRASLAALRRTFEFIDGMTANPGRAITTRPGGRPSRAGTTPRS